MKRGQICFSVLPLHPSHPSDLIQVGEVLSDIIRDKQHAGEIILS
jgi:hypothetical protein